MPPELADGVVLDTDVASRILRDKLTGPLRTRLLGRFWCVTFVSVAELWKWAELRSWGPDRRAELEGWLGDVTVLPSDDQVSRIWAQISAGAVRRGRARPANDTWIAAGCIARELPLANLNTKDFADFAERDGLTLLE